MKPRAPKQPPSGFTLLETTLSLAVLAIIISGAMVFANAALGLSKAATEAQEEARVVDGWTELLRGSLSQLPPEATLELEVTSSGAGYLPVLSIDDPGPSFSLAGVMPPGSRVEIFSQPTIDGSLRVGLRWYDPEQTEVMKTGQTVPPVASLRIIDRLTQWNIEAWDTVKRTWEPVWDSPQRPPYLRITMQRSGENAESIAFSLPPRRSQAATGETPGPPGGGPGPGPQGNGGPFVRPQDGNNPPPPGGTGGNNPRPDRGGPPGPRP